MLQLCFNFNYILASLTIIDIGFSFRFQLLRESGSSVLEIMKFGVSSFVNIPVQVSPVKSRQVGVFVKLLHCLCFTTR